MRYLFLCLSLVLGVVFARKPNVLFVVIDDLGFDDVGFRSHEIKTPNIDTLAAKGVILDQYYVQDVCSPSRSTFMTGRYAMHHSIVDWIPPASAYGLPLNETTMAQKMKEAGYMAHMSGKWHLGFFKWAYTPTFRGFDSFLGFYSGGEDYFKHTSSGGYDFRRDPEPRCGKGCSNVQWEDQGNYSTIVFTREAVRVVKEHDSNRPLFLYLAYQGVHAPAQVPDSYIEPYKNTIQDSKRRTFAGMLSAVDEGIGNVTRALADRGMLEDTLIVFTSDNGGPTTTGDGVGARNWPLRGGKHSIWEGGVRATAFVSGHGISPSVQGTTYTGLMHGADWLPTLGQVAGYGLNGTLTLDGVSQWAAINRQQATGSSTGSLPRGTKLAPIYPARKSVVLGNSTNDCSWAADDPRAEKYRQLSATAKAVGCGFAIRNAQWKLIKGYGGGPDTWCNSTAGKPDCLPYPPNDTKCPNGYCLYDVVEDPAEFKEVAEANPDVVDQLRKEMDTVLDSYVQYTIDESCPQHKFVQNPHVGPTWEPWCG